VVVDIRSKLVGKIAAEIADARLNADTNRYGVGGSSGHYQGVQIPIGVISSESTGSKFKIEETY